MQYLFYSLSFRQNVYLKREWQVFEFENQLQEHMWFFVLCVKLWVVALVKKVLLWQHLTMIFKKHRTIFLSAYDESNMEAARMELEKTDADKVGNVKILKTDLNIKILDADDVVLNLGLLLQIKKIMRFCVMKLNPFHFLKKAHPNV